MSYRLWIKRDGEWYVYGEYKSKVIAEIHKGLIMDNETKIEEIES